MAKMRRARRNFRRSIPETNQTNPEKFPEREYKPYPRMLVKEDENGKMVAVKGKNGKPITFQSEEEENEYHGKKSKPAAKVADLVKEETVEETTEEAKPSKKVTKKKGK